jgi:two-component system KDP operon response regulator KdpE
MTGTNATILVVDDEPEIRRFLKSSLCSAGYRTVTSATGHRGTIDAATHKPDLAIVDLGLPDLNGLEVIRSIRSWSPMPIIVLSARAQERVKLDAFDAGADDYVTKPFGVAELLARVRLALRHAVWVASGSRILALGEVTIDLDARIARNGDTRIHLTPIEYRIIGCLANHLGMVVTHRELLVTVWGPTHAEDTHYLRIYMKQLRDKLESDPVRPCHLQTEIGVGYRLVADSAWQTSSIPT